uniref:Uncharacterized protein n=1 Tax=Anguilla anguilla TaxID=7936 RepID=A0A0E9VD31_ANGAN
MIGYTVTCKRIDSKSTNISQALLSPIVFTAAM